MAILVTGLVVFFAAHFYSTFRTREPALDIKQRLGERKYMGAYSIVSIVGFGLIVWGYRSIDPGEYLYSGLSGANSLRAIVMLPAFVFLAAANLPVGYIKRALRHPMLIAVMIWAVAHLLTGATLAKLLLFGTFFVYSVIDLMVVSFRNPSSNLDSSNLDNHQAVIKSDVIAVLLGSVAYYVTITWLHSGM